MDLITDSQQLNGWMPIRVKWHGPEPMIDWCRVDDDQFTEPFFDQTIERLLQRPFNLIFRRFTDIDALRLAAAELESVKPIGFIFHISRCGSTLVSRMLASLRQNIAISESSALDWIIRAKVRRAELTDEQHVEWIRWMIAAMAQKRSADAEHFYVKFDGWHILYFDLIKRAFPDVPWVFLYREPVEVLVSHSKQPSSATVPGIIEYDLSGLSIYDAIQTPIDEFPARVLGRFSEAALAQADDPNGLFINYNRLPGAATGEMLQHFGVNYSDEDIASMLNAAGKNAKQPSIDFVPDSTEKREAANEELRSNAERFMRTSFEGLERAAEIQRARYTA